MFLVHHPHPFWGCEILEMHGENAHISILKNPNFRNKYWAYLGYNQFAILTAKLP